jgi:hypothetical protein
MVNDDDDDDDEVGAFSGMWYLLTKQHRFTSQKTVTFILSKVRTSRLLRRRKFTFVVTVALLKYPHTDTCPALKQLNLDL